MEASVAAIVAPVVILLSLLVIVLCSIVAVVLVVRNKDKVKGELEISVETILSCLCIWNRVL